MNFAITGKKIVSSPQPEKKGTQLPLKPKVQPKSQIFKPIVKKPSVPAQNKPKPTNVLVKKQQIKKEEPKIIEPEVKPQPEVKNLQQPPKICIQQIPEQPSKQSQILVRYNHYKDKFPTQNNILKYQLIEDKYGFASVFKGNYLPKLQIYRNYSKYIDPLTSGAALDYTWEVQQGRQYEITITQDEQEERKYERKAYIAPKQQSNCSLKKNQRVAELTQQMRNMKVQELGSQKHKQLLEQRALQEVLFS